jgi:hypothetical protein
LNFAIPIAFLVFFGFLIDTMCTPAKSDKKINEE